MKALRGAACAAAGSLSALCFVIGAEGYAGMSDPPASSASYLWCALALVFAWLFFHAWGGGRRPGVAEAVFGLAFGVANTLGGMLFAYDSWAMLQGGGTLALTALRCLGQALPMTAFFTLLRGWLCGGALTGPGSLEKRALSRFSLPRRHETLCLAAVLLLCWSPYLVAFFPGSMSWDLGEMAAQFFGLREMDTWHSVFLTWLFGGALWLGRLLGSDNAGAALYTALQALLLAFALSQTLVFLRKRGINRAARLVALCFFCLTPLFGGYAQFICKDTLYSAALALFALRAAEALVSGEKGERPAKRTLCGLFAWGLLACLMRTNGLYVVGPTALLLLLFGAKGRGRLALTAALLPALCLALAFTNALLPALSIKDETASGLYSVCFQQSARALRDHGEEIIPEEYAEIDRVLDGANLAALYEPWISDPVKYTFKFYGQGAAAEKEALARYRQTWWEMAKKYPLTYAEAFFAGNVSYYAFTPKFEGKTYNNQAGNRLVFETYSLGDDPLHAHIVQPEGLEGARTLLALFARGWRRVPLLSLLYACPFYTWLLVGAALAVARRRRWRLLCAFLPALMTLGVCMLSPVNDYFRYFLPIVLMTPALLGLAGKAASQA